MKASVDHRYSLVLSALGVVFGDIGTSPLYAFQTALNASAETGPEASLGVASLIIWSLLAIVTCKYVLLVMRADYKGEGGIFALLALLGGKDPPSRRVRLPFFMLLLMFGAALVYGDGVITPAISVLSAVEGLEDFSPQLTAFVLPITLAILLVVFAVQRFGTGPLGALFGGIMLFWFVTLGLGGLVQILQTPGVLVAFDPRHALGAVAHGGLRSAFLLGGVVLAVTGVEALYADMGHFGHQAISRAWHCIVLPSLILNYLGLAAIAIRHPGASREGSLFFQMVPQGIATLLLVLLATLATIIASQALISGVFSLTAQARDLGLLPRFLVCHEQRPAWASLSTSHQLASRSGLPSARHFLPFQRKSRGGLRLGGDGHHGDHVNRFWACRGTGLAPSTLDRGWYRGNSTVFGASVLFFGSAQVCKRGLVSYSHRQRPDGAHVDVAQGKGPDPSTDAIDSMF